jgi:putative peptidoglycan lipid II flippase
MKEPTTTQGLSGGGIARAAGLVMLGFVLSRVLGLVRDAIIAGVFGGGRLADVYFTASRPPETIFFVVAGGSLASAFIPTYVGYLAKDQRGQAWRMTSAVINLITLLLIGLSVIGAVFAPEMVRLILAPDFDAEKTALTADLARIMLISPAIFGISGLLMGILNAHQRFLLPALAPALYNIGIILGAIFLSPSMGVYGLAWGTVLGALLHLIVQIPGLIQVKPHYSLSLDLTHPGVWEVLRLMGPRVLGLAVVQINFWVELFLASGMVEGSISALRRAFTLMLLPQGVIAQSVAIAVFPTFAAQVARGDRAALKRTHSQVLRAVLFLSLPATVGLILLRLPLARLLFERGAFTRQESEAVAWALLFYGLGLVFHCLLEIVTRAYYAMHDTRTPVAIGGLAMILNIVFSLLFMRLIGDPNDLVIGPFGGLALANTVATALEVILLLILIRPRVGGLEGGALVLSALRAGAASAVMGIGLWWAAPLIDQVSLFVSLPLLIGAGGAVYIGVAWLLGSEEVRLFAGAIRRRVGAS